MSSEIYEFDGSCFFNDPFSPFNDSSSTIDILQPFQDYNPLLALPSQSPPLTTNENLDIPTLLSTSPPSNQLENLSIYQKGISVTSSNEVLDFCPVKTETCQRPLYDHDHYYYDGSDHHAFKMMQRSYSSNSCQQETTNGGFYQHEFNGLIDHTSSYMRRVCSTGDLHSSRVKETSQRLSSSPLATESSLMEEANFKIGRYNAEEKKEKILRYRAKRTQRNFNKTIKYACRKTLADNRPRVRGRFARNDEPGEAPKSPTFHQYRVEDELWIEGLYEDDCERMIRRPQFFNIYSSTAQFQQFNFIHN